MAWRLPVGAAALGVVTILLAAPPAGADAPVVSWTTSGRDPVKQGERFELKGEAGHDGQQGVDAAGVARITFEAQEASCQPRFDPPELTSPPDGTFTVGVTFDCTDDDLRLVAMAEANRLDGGPEPPRTPSQPLTLRVEAPPPPPAPPPPAPEGDAGPPTTLTKPRARRGGGGRVGSPRVAPPLNPADPTSTLPAEPEEDSRATTTTTDGERGDGSVVAEIDDEGGGDDVRDVVVPVAFGLILLVGAFQLRYLVKRATPGSGPPGGPGEIEPIEGEPSTPTGPAWAPAPPPGPAPGDGDGLIAGPLRRGSAPPAPRPVVGDGPVAATIEGEAAGDGAPSVDRPQAPEGLPERPPAVDPPRPPATARPAMGSGMDETHGGLDEAVLARRVAERSRSIPPGRLRAPRPSLAPTPDPVPDSGRGPAPPAGEPSEGNGRPSSLADPGELRLTLPPPDRISTRRREDARPELVLDLGERRQGRRPRAGGPDRR